MRVSSLLCLLPALAALPSLTGAAPVEQTALAKRATFQKGVNQPWGNGLYAHWFSTDLLGNTASYNEQDVINTFSAAKQIGAGIVRVWMFERGQGITIDGNKYATGIRSDLYSNFDNLLSHAAQYGILVQPTFFNYPPNTSDFPVANFFTDANANTALMNNVVTPFVTRYGSNPSIQGFQLYNELNGFSNPYFSTYSVNQAAVKTWVTNTVKTVKAKSSKPVSVSQILISDQYHPASSSNNDYVGTGVDSYDIHVYNDQGTLPTAAGLGLDKPVVLGEFGESTAQGDAHQATVVQNFLNNAKNGGYSGAWYWSLGYYGKSQLNPADACPDSSLKYSLYNCEGNGRSAWTTFKNFI